MATICFAHGHIFVHDHTIILHMATNYFAHCHKLFRTWPQFSLHMTTSWCMATTNSFAHDHKFVCTVHELSLHMATFLYMVTTKSFAHDHNLLCTWPHVFAHDHIFTRPQTYFAHDHKLFCTWPHFAHCHKQSILHMASLCAHGRMCCTRPQCIASGNIFDMTTTTCCTRSQCI